MNAKQIYLDYNATTSTDQRVLEVMLPYFTEVYGNASSVNHTYGWDAEEAVTIAREHIAELVNVKPTEITFTSGATEAINIALMGYCKANQHRGNHMITCVTEHKAVLDTCEHLEQLGFKVTYLPVDPSGKIQLESLKSAITERTILATFMYANNETGVIHPMKEISEITSSHDVVLMTDATQALGKIPVNLKEIGVDIATFSSHKIYGPKGVGALYLSGHLKGDVLPILFGGGQERGLRPGTLNVPGIVGMGTACEIISTDLTGDSLRLKALQTILENELLTIEGLAINGANSPRIPNTTNFSIEGVDGSRLVRTLKNLAISQGSACTSSVLQPSHVLKSMGMSDDLALSSLRISTGRFTLEEEITEAVLEIKKAVELLKVTA
ncbi:MAG: cysteine desulfurase family protein [Marinoscillum sp.]